MSFFRRLFPYSRQVSESAEEAPTGGNENPNQRTAAHPTAAGGDVELPGSRIDNTTPMMDRGADVEGQHDDHSDEDDDDIVLVDPPPASAAAGATTSEPGVLDMEALVRQKLFYIRSVSRIIIILTVLQIMSTLATEQIHFLSLFSLFVPSMGYEGAKERNFAYLRIFYWGCWIMIPANFFHFISFGQFVHEALASPNLDDKIKKELVFNNTLFNTMTILITIGTIMCLFWLRQLSIMIRSLRQELFERDFGGNLDHPRHQNGGRGNGPAMALSSEEILAIPSFKIQPEDIPATAEAAEREVCVICQDEFQLNDLAKRLTCRHLFHAKCIDAWLERSSLCPICNGDVRSIV